MDKGIKILIIVGILLIIVLAMYFYKKPTAVQALNTANATAQGSADALSAANTTKQTAIDSKNVQISQLEQNAADLKAKIIGLKSKYTYIPYSLVVDDNYLTTQENIRMNSTGAGTSNQAKFDAGLINTTVTDYLKAKNAIVLANNELTILQK